MRMIKKDIIFHPVLFGIYPALALYFYNRYEIAFETTQKMFLSEFTFSFLIISFCWIIFRSFEKAAIPSSLMLFFFYFYGHVYDVVKRSDWFVSVLGRHRLFFPLWAIIAFIVLILIKKIKHRKNINDALNMISLFLVGFIAIQFSSYLIQVFLTSSQVSETLAAQSGEIVENNTERDVYYILVDAYSREDLLQKEVNLDISEFTSELIKLGFYIPSCSQSNYDSTKLSMISSLNMDYIDTLGIQHNTNRTKFTHYFQNNLVIQKFKNLGYSIATFKSLYPTLDIKDVDYYHDYFSNTSTFSSHAGLNIQYLFLRTTLIRPLIELVETMDDDSPYFFVVDWIPVKRAISDRNLRQYEQNLFALDSLKKIPDLPGNKFVYAHIFVSHQPFVFYPDGRFHPDLPQYPSAYRDQIVFLNQRLLDIVKTILDNSAYPPVIVIQSDHSYFEGEDRVKILNAYYFPDGGDKALYDSITPVNTFRLIFDLYFGEENGLLPDISRYVNAEDKLQEVPITCVKETP